jgi:signal transduction histidine kinase
VPRQVCTPLKRPTVAEHYGRSLELFENATPGTDQSAIRGGLVGPEMRHTTFVAEPTSDRLVLIDDLRRAERHAIVSRLSSVFAHLIGTPLNVIAGRAALIKSNPTGDATLENATRIEQQVERLAYRIRKLIDYWTLVEVDLGFSPVTAIVGNALALQAPVAAKRKVEVVVVSGELPETSLETSSTLVVLTNLLSLSTLVAAPGSRIELSITSPDPRTVLFALTVPGFEPPSSRIDRLDPPEDDRDRSRAERLQVLSVCHAVADQRGAHLDVHAADREQIRFRCPAR